MPPEDRAAQFAPFAALVGYGDAIDETVRLTDSKVELTEDVIAELNAKLAFLSGRLSEEPVVSLTYFVPDAKKKGGEVDNMGYALPACNVKRLWLLLKDSYLSGNTFGKNNFGVTRAYLSAGYEAVWTYPEIEITAGGIVSDVVETVAVTKSGGNLQSGDVIKNVSIISSSGETVDGISVKRAYHIDDVLLSLRSGGKVIVTVDRNGTEIEVEASCTTKKVA